MKQKKRILPALAVGNIIKNKATYYPYLGVSMFAMFTYFVFDLILKNDVMQSIPKATYAMALVQVGFALLGIIMIPFLYYTNSFLMKRRKKELGLYSILGMEKKHIGIMMFFESLIIYVVVLAGAIAVGLLFSKLIFLLLLNLAKIQVEASFAISPTAILDTTVFYAIITGLNLFVNLIQVGKSNPAELMSDAKGGEKEPKHLILLGLLGMILTGMGYYIAVSAEINSEIFMDFFLAVFLVILGTYFIFTSGSIAILKRMKKNTKKYYQKANFITVSGMLYRMKKNGASLSNICIFATMVMITVICTISIYLGMDSIISFKYPRDIVVDFIGEDESRIENLETLLTEKVSEFQLTQKDTLFYSYKKVSGTMEGEIFRVSKEEDSYADRMSLMLMTLEEYERITGNKEDLDEQELIIYSTGEDFSKTSIALAGTDYSIVKELQEFQISRKEKNNVFDAFYILIVKDEMVMDQIAQFYGVDVGKETMSTEYTFSLNGTDEHINELSQSLYESVSAFPGFAEYANYRGDQDEVQSMYGGLMFIGIFFGSIFFICLIIIMYYKQITEGFEDQRNFEIMQKVGMSDEEIKATIKKQIRLVFGLPLVGAVIHTLIGMQMVIMLMSVIWMYETWLIAICTVAIIITFAGFYGFSYKKTAKAYYRIVKN